MEALLSIFAPENLLAFITLTALEIVLGVDNVVFIAVLSARLPPEKQRMARRIGLIGAMFMRIALLACINWVRSLTGEVFSGIVAGHQFNVTWRDLVLLIGGLVLLFKATREIHHVSSSPQLEAKPKSISFSGVIAQIMLMDIVFSLDSVITAVGMVEHLPTMILAVIASVGVMMFAAEPISNFVEHRRSVKVLALSFLLLIGVMLVAEGLGTHVSKGYIYFAMAFALGVEMVNYRADNKALRAAQAALERKEALRPRHD